jgi:GNAT superfamily N-acetyltransferase
MRIRRLPDAAAFFDVAGAFLVEHEALNNLLLGIASSSKADPTRDDRSKYFAAVMDGDHVVGAARMTPPHHLQLSPLPDAAIDAVVGDLASGGWTLPGVNGPTATSDAFAAAWCAARGGRASVHMNLRGFELTLVGAWYRAFYGEADIHAGPIPPEENARRAIRDGRVFLWDDGGPVAQTVLSGRTPNGARIGGVYTPTDVRRRGYATALVAEVSRAQLAAGRKFCFLLTDLANPVSNSIYPKIGYRAVADFREYDFVDG